MAYDDEYNNKQEEDFTNYRKEIREQEKMDRIKRLCVVVAVILAPWITGWAYSKMGKPTDKDAINLLKTILGQWVIGIFILFIIAVGVGVLLLLKLLVEWIWEG